MAFNKKKNAKEFIEMFSEPMEKFAFTWEIENEKKRQSKN